MDILVIEVVKCRLRVRRNEYIQLIYLSTYPMGNCLNKKQNDWHFSWIRDHDDGNIVLLGRMYEGLQRL